MIYYGDKDPVSTVRNCPSVRCRGGKFPRNEIPMTKILKTSAEGRRCKFPNCQHLLSIYNHQAYCRVHLEQVPLEEKQKPLRHA